LRGKKRAVEIEMLVNSVAVVIEEVDARRCMYVVVVENVLD